MAVPGEVFKQICEAIILTYQETLGWVPEVEIELEREPDVWRITIRLKRSDQEPKKALRGKDEEIPWARHHGKSDA